MICDECRKQIDLPDVITKQLVFCTLECHDEYFGDIPSFEDAEDDEEDEQWDAGKKT